MLLKLEFIEVEAEEQNVVLGSRLIFECASWPTCFWKRILHSSTWLENIAWTVRHYLVLERPCSNAGNVVAC